MTKVRIQFPVMAFVWNIFVKYSTVQHSTKREIRLRRRCRRASFNLTLFSNGTSIKISSSSTSTRTTTISRFAPSSAQAEEVPEGSKELLLQPPPPQPLFFCNPFSVSLARCLSSSPSSSSVLLRTHSRNLFRSVIQKARANYRPAASLGRTESAALLSTIFHRLITYL